MTAALNPQQRDVLTRFAKGGRAGDIAYAAGLKARVVQQVIDDWCDNDRERARLVLAEDDARRPAVAAPQQPAPPPAAAAPPDWTNPVGTNDGPPARPADEQPDPAIAPTQPPAPLPTITVPSSARTATPEAILEAGLAHGNAKLRSMAARVRTLLDDLAAALEDEDRTREARERVAQLERELAAARAMLRPVMRGGDTETDPATVRAWARSTGVDCPKLGRVPRKVLDAYAAAHGGGRG